MLRGVSYRNTIVTRSQISYDIYVVVYKGPIVSDATGLYFFFHHVFELKSSLSLWVVLYCYVFSDVTRTKKYSFTERPSTIIILYYDMRIIGRVRIFVCMSLEDITQ